MLQVSSLPPTAFLPQYRNHLGLSRIVHNSVII